MPKAATKSRSQKRREDGLCTLYVRIPPELNHKLNLLVGKGFAAGDGSSTRQKAIIKILKEARV